MTRKLTNAEALAWGDMEDVLAVLTGAKKCWGNKSLLEMAQNAGDPKSIEHLQQLVAETAEVPIGDGLAACVRLAKMTAEVQRSMVMWARQQGLSWAKIGDILEVKPQSVWEKYRQVDDAEPSSLG